MTTRMAPRTTLERPAAAALLAPALLFALAATSMAQGEPDRDGDGLSDFVELHKHLTDPDNADSDGDGVPDGDWHERREYQYTVRSVVQVMRPVTIEYLTDDHQDARVLAETDEYVELEVIHYPFTTVAASIPADPDWRRTTAPMTEWTRPGPTNDWTPAMRDELVAALAEHGIHTALLDDRTLVERASRWLCERTRQNDCFLAFATAFDADGKPFVPADLTAAVATDAAELARRWQRDISARGMFAQRVRGSCSSSSIYLNGCLRALGVPTRTVLCIPVVDANDEGERAMIDGLQHHALRAQLQQATARLRGQWASHSCNEVFVGGRWRRLDYDRLGQGIADPQSYGLVTHVATFSDWACARMPETIGRRQTLRRYDDHFGGPNPYSTVELADAFGAHCTLPNPVPPPPTARVTAVHWGDGNDVPDDVRAWFGSRRQFGLVARVEGLPDLRAVARLLADDDRHVLLVAAHEPPVHIDLDHGTMWWRGDHALVAARFDGRARTDFDAAADYLFVLRAHGARSAWRDVIALPVPPRPR